MLHLHTPQFLEPKDLVASMQLIIAGASGYLATELVRQALSHPKITTLYALARHRIPTPGNLGPNAELSKLMTMTVEDYDEYAGGVGEAFTRADACIWYGVYDLLNCCSCPPKARIMVKWTSTN